MATSSKYILAVMVNVNLGMLWAASGPFWGWLLPQKESRLPAALAKIRSRNSQIYRWRQLLEEQPFVGPKLLQGFRQVDGPQKEHSKRRGACSSSCSRPKERSFLPGLHQRTLPQNGSRTVPLLYSSYRD